MQGIRISHTITSSQNCRAQVVSAEAGRTLMMGRGELGRRKFCCGTKFDKFPLVSLDAIPNV